MAMMAVPLASEKLAAWERWSAELAGPRRSEFEDMNSRHGLTTHQAYLQPAPGGDYLVLVVHDGPGSDEFMASVAASDHEFDRWFLEQVADLHDMDPSGSPPPPAERRI